ncbi:30S ribosomal protein S19e [Methanomicrobium antiquum]|uniref:Small ribosomal subunit protein eS19 n=1 Tax=Methanomicrobium antiquum TaxID=487686 RepID=A0AAF0FQ75_9EURY|nr:30S ribosomal protein S19e [Methanomicrobium antiquum]MDD3976890.1 30S ribosomal protein S19e [Methanomicrobium sp.]WFN37567.1 30S ribosomal protein S19e [Methanomicrobium antiquum]
MTTVYDIPPDVLIAKVAGELKQLDSIKAPVWAEFAKTGVHKQMPPKEEDWWYTRAASVMRRVYIDGPVGVQRLRSFYGGKKNRGTKPNQFKRGSGSVTRKLLQQLESAGYIKNTPEGRVISAEGRKFMDSVANSAKAEVVEQIPGLSKY